MSIHYTVSLHNPNAHLFKITLEILSPSADGQLLSLPAWIPGSYMIRDFARNITQIRAWSGNNEIQLAKIDKSSWKVPPLTTPLIIEYEVYAWDLSVRSAHMDMTHAFYNGTSLFLMPHGFENQPMTVDIIKPSLAEMKDWYLTTSLRNKTTDESGFGLYQADDYDDLIDHPVEIGTHTQFHFEIENTKHSMALTGKHRADFDRLKKDLTKICQVHCTMFGELPSLDEYIFLVMVTGDGYGGLEHRSSTSLLCSRNDLPLSSEPDEPGESYRNFLGLCSHEYFHTWNVKRIKPSAFLPYDLSSETYTQQLWAFEGITSYYDELALVRSGVISVTSYLELIGQTITRVIRGKGHKVQTVAESSFDAWTKFYKQDENAPNAIISYYTKGALIALCLDLTLRLNSDNTFSLDDVMRYLWVNYGKKNIGVAEGEIEKIVSKLSGTDLTSFFASYLYGLNELPLSSLLKQFGIVLNMRETSSLDDKGGKPVENSKSVAIGARFVADAAGAKISHCFNGQSAEVAGLAAGDVVISINKLQVNKSVIDKVIESYPVGEVLKIHAFRRDELMEFNVTLQQAESTTCYLEIDDKAEDSVIKRRDKWLLTA